MTTTDTPIIYRGYRIIVSEDEGGHIGWTELPEHGSIFTHTYPDAKQALAAAIAVVDMRELYRTR